jgi:hypothetical protein
MSDVSGSCRWHGIWSGRRTVDRLFDALVDSAACTSSFGAPDICSCLDAGRQNLHTCQCHQNDTQVTRVPQQMSWIEGFGSKAPSLPSDQGNRVPSMIRNPLLGSNEGVRPAQRRGGGNQTDRFLRATGWSSTVDVGPTRRRCPGQMPRPAIQRGLRRNRFGR